MTGHDDFDRTLSGWFTADALSPAPPGDFERVLDATRRRTPRPAWLARLGSDWVGEAPNRSSWGARPIPRLGAGWSTAFILLLAVVALVGGAILVGSLLRQPPPLPGRLGHLAYGLDGDIFVADWDGNNPILIADGDPFGGTGAQECGSFGADGPMWSPDGQHLAFGSEYETCGWSVHLTDPEGHLEASIPGSRSLHSWSPDSTRIATWVEESQAIGVYGLNGVRQALLALPPGLSPGDAGPVWSPNGRSLLISLAPLPPTQIPAAVWELPLDGGAPRPVPAEDPRSHSDARFSRDQSRVAFNENGYLVVAAADGSDARLLAQAGQTILWSPAGDRVALTWTFSFGGPGAPTNLRVMDVASGNAWELTGASQIEPVRFSPKGDRLLVWTADHDDVRSLWSVNIGDADTQRPLSAISDHSDARLLVSGAGTWGDWQWQPAGE